MVLLQVVAPYRGAQLFIHKLPSQCFQCGEFAGFQYTGQSPIGIGQLCFSIQKQIFKFNISATTLIYSYYVYSHRPLISY